MTNFCVINFVWVSNLHIIIKSVGGTKISDFELPFQ